MKISQALQITLDKGLYVAKGQNSGSFRTTEGEQFLCHSLMAASAQGFITQDARNAAIAFVNASLEEYSTLVSHLNHTDKAYARLNHIYGHWHKFCFNRRVKWIKAQIAKLQSQGR